MCRASWCRLCGEEPDSPKHILRRWALMTVRFRLFGTIFPSYEDVRRDDAVRPWWRPPGSYRADRLRPTEWVRRERQQQVTNSFLPIT